MKKTNLIRNAHFLGTKVRNLRKRNHLTMEDLSARCMKINVEASPSVSYISMIERGKRYPSETMLAVIAQVFEKDIQWFLNDVPDGDEIIPDKGSRGGLRGIALEPSFLFSDDILQIAIPEMLSQAGVSGRQFAQLLIRAHQENNQNHFPELERAAEEVGKKQMPIGLDVLFAICKQLGMTCGYFDQLSAAEEVELGLLPGTFIRSYFKFPGTIMLNRLLEKQPARLKYDLAVHIAHMVLHNGDGVKNPLTADRRSHSVAKADALGVSQSKALDAQDIVHAWRDFECSFFAGALLCPKVPFRRLLEQNAHEISVGGLIDVSRSVAMRRMTAVSNYPYWHYFDAYAADKLNAVYRGNGIPLPWGNMRQVEDPCNHWAVFRMLSTKSNDSSAQISLMNVGDETRIYCCESVNVSDITGSDEVLCAGIDINPALDAQGKDARSIAADLMQVCVERGGNAEIPASIKKDLASVARILNIAWLQRGIEKEARVICPRRGACPRKPCCQKSSYALPKKGKR